MNSKLKRWIASLLLAITFISLLPTNIYPVYADGNYSGGGDGDASVSGSGTFDSRWTGYRLWLMNDQGQQVANKVDLWYTDPTTLGVAFNWTFNTKVESWTGKSTEAAKNTLFSDLQGNFTSALPRPVISISKGKYEGQGEELKKWMTDGVAIVQPSYSYSGSSSGTKYTYKGNKNNQGSSQGGSSQGSQGGTGSTTNTENIYTVCVSINKAASSTMKLYLAHPSYYTRAQAISGSAYAAQLRYNSLIKTGAYTKEEQDLLLKSLNEATDELESSTGYDGWKDSKSNSSSDKKKANPATKNPDKNIDTNNSNGFNKGAGGKRGQDQASLINNIFSIDTLSSGGLIIDIAYADEKSSGNITEKGNIYPLLNSNNLFDFSGTGLTIMSNNIDTIAANNLKLIIEPIVWFQPATCVSNGSGGWKIGTSPNWWFYGTPTTYASMMVYNKQHGKWHDGGSGKGGWYANTLNKVMSICLYLDNPLMISGETVNLVSSITPKSDYQVPNTELSRTDLGYALHYVRFGGAPDLPSTHTYDEKTPEPKNPHPAPDPDPEKPTPENPNIPLLPKEPDHPEKTPDNPEPGYRETTRTINIIKVYDVEKIDGTIEHVETLDRQYNPGTITIQHEPDYKCIGYFSSEAYYGKVIAPITPDIQWVEFNENELIPHNSEIDWETKYEEVKDTSAGDSVTTIKIGLAADPEYDPEKATGEPKNGYNDTTLYVHLLKKETPPETSTWDEDNYPDGPGPAPDPTITPEPSQDPVDPDNPFLHYRIVKVYEEENITKGTITHITTTERYPTVPIILIEDENEYKVIEWKHGTPYTPVNSSTEWNDPAISNVNPDGSGTSTDVKVDIRPVTDGTYDNEEETTLYVRLRKKVKDIVQPPAISEDLTESQLTKISNTNSTVLGWSGYEFTAHIDAAFKGGYCHCKGCSCEDCGCSCYMSRIYGDHIVSATFGMKQEWKDSHETTVYHPSAHSDFAGKMYGKGGTVSDSIKFEENNLSDSSYDWSLGSDGSSEDGIEYITTICRGSVGDKLNLAKYKQNAMDSTSYNRVNTIFPGSNTPTGKRLANGVLNETIGYTVGHIAFDDKSTSECRQHLHSNPKTVHYNMQELPLSGAFKIFVYGGKGAKTATKAPTNIQGFIVGYADGNSTTSALFVKQQSATIKFYPYIKMSYQITRDNISFPGYNADPSTANSRTVYMLSDKQSTIIPTNSVEVSWFNKTQADGGYGLQMTSQQWSVHNRATQGSDGWQGKNQVLPGGALYALSTQGTESYIKTITYNTLIENDSRNWISVSDTSKYTTQSIIKSTQDYLNEAKKVIENYRVVEWVNTNIGLDTAWQNTGTAVKIQEGGEDLGNIGLSGRKANTDAKYVLFNGSDDNTNGASEADLDIIRESYQTRVYKGFSDIDGNIYIAWIEANTDIKMLDQSTLDQMVNLLKPVCGTKKLSSLSGLPSNMTYSIVSIGKKSDTTSAIISNLQNNISYNFLYQLDLKTKFITNLIDSVERNTGSDALNATWSTDEKWYNEAFDGMYEVVQTATYKMGLGVPQKRVSILDPNLCPAKKSTSDIFTTAHLSQFCLDAKSTIAQDKDDGYVGTFEGIEVYIPNLDTMLYSRPFFIPNANVQDTVS